MRKKWLLAGSLLLIIAVVGLTGCALGTAAEGQTPSNLSVNLSNQQQGVSVTGEGKVTVTPDLAVMSMGISAKAATVAEAQAQAAEAMNKVMNALTDNGVDKKDIQTQQFNITQLTRWDQDKEEEIIIGYQVSNMVTAKIRSLAQESYPLDYKVGRTIDAVAAAGGDLTRINGISFTVDNPKPYYTQARELAMNDAKAKAEQMAGLSGITLGKPTFISESSSYPVPMPVPVYKDAASAPTTPISLGQIDITLNVQVIYSIL